MCSSKFRVIMPFLPLNKNFIGPGTRNPDTCTTNLRLLFFRFVSFRINSILPPGIYITVKDNYRYPDKTIKIRRDWLPKRGYVLSTEYHRKQQLCFIYKAQPCPE